MKQLTIILLITLNLIACGQTSPIANPPSPATTAAPHFIIESSGQNSLKRQAWTGDQPIPLTFGTPIQEDDHLHLQGSITILCSNLTLLTLAGGGEINCLGGEPFLQAGQRRYSTLRTSNQNIPYILHPRRTLLLTNTPPLRWHHTGATAYTVALEQGGTTLWQLETSTACQTEPLTCQMPYPPNQPPLQPTLTYQLLIVDNDSQTSSKQDPNTGLGFQLADPALKTEIEADQKKMTLASVLNPEAGQFALALYYFNFKHHHPAANFSPMAQAETLFKTLAATTQSPALYLWHADSLMEMKLPTEAQPIYQQAHNLAQANGNLETQVQAATALWKITKNQNNRQQAIDLYKQLGDQTQLELLQKEQ